MTLTWYFLEYKPEYLELIECDQATMVKEEKRSVEVSYIANNT